MKSHKHSAVSCLTRFMQLLLVLPLVGWAAENASMRIVGECVPAKPWTVAGERGALLGRQDGSFEAWLWPVKIFSGFRISAELADYPVPIDVNALASTIEVSPHETVITYSHAAFTLRQHAFAPRGQSSRRAGAMVYYEIESVRPLSLTFAFTPDMLRMWPAPNFGRPNAEWVQDGDSGVYVLHTDNENVTGLIAMPGTHPGVLVPYQEHPQTYPAQLKLQFDPKKDAGRRFPLVFAIRNQNTPSKQAAELFSSFDELRTATAGYYAHFFDTRLTVNTPDTRLNDAARWAEVSVDQTQVAYQNDEIGLVAGFYSSADSARPGFAWFFGRDTLWTTYAINSYGDFALTRRALDFLLRRQRDDGKIMHEFSQSAGFVDWKATPYFYASADSTLLLAMAMRDYVKASGDVNYLREHWDAVKKAYAFARAHDADGDGIYDNSEGTGWVESWPGGMPRQEIYMAALDEQASQAMVQLAGWMKDDAQVDSASKAVKAIAGRIPGEYIDSSGLYAFSYNKAGAVDKTASIYPAVAWWDGTYALPHPETMLSRWASAEFSTDWGTRDISDRTPFYDPISYHQGSVWPLFTGWVSLAEYRAGRPLSGYAHMMQNANQTWSQDLGAVTELLSGEFFQPLGRSTSHQMWSSAMVLTPLLRGLFGLDWDAPAHTLHVAPSLPANWDRASLHNVALGDLRLDVEFRREGDHWTVSGKANGNGQFCLQGTAPTQGCASSIQVAVKPVEIAIPAELPLPGAATTQLKVIDESYDERHASFTFAAIGGSKYSLPVRLHRATARSSGAEITADHLQLSFPEGKGYQTVKVNFSW